jgi:hypothetical protein
LKERPVEGTGVGIGVGGAGDGVGGGWVGILAATAVAEGASIAPSGVGFSATALPPQAAAKNRTKARMMYAGREDIYISLAAPREARKAG